MTQTPKIANLRRMRSMLAALVVVYAILAGATHVITPPGHSPDELAHMAYVQTIASGRLPVFHAGASDYEAHQPPLYYLLCAPVALAARGHGDVMSAVRWVSTALGAILILVTYFCVADLFPAEPLLALGAAIFVALLPMNVSLSSSVTNDALTDLVMAVGVWLLTRFIISAGTENAILWKRAVWLGVVLGAGIWTKTSTLILFPAVLLTCYLLAREKLVTQRSAAEAAGVSVGLGALIGLPWLVRNQVLYGDPVAQHLFVTAFQNTAKADTMLPLYGSLTGYLVGVAEWTFASFWGGFDSMTLFWGQDPRGHGNLSFYFHAPPIIYGVLLALCAMALVGLIGMLRARPSRLSTPQRIALGVFAALIVFNGIAFLRFILTFFQAQGRYWYPALVPLAVFFILGWRGLFPRPAWFRVVIGLIALGLLALNIYTIFFLLPARFYAETLPRF